MKKTFWFVVLALFLSVGIGSSAGAQANTIVPTFELNFEDVSNIGDLDRHFFYDINNDGINDYVLTPFGGSTGGSVRTFISNGDGTASLSQNIDIGQFGVNQVQGAYGFDANSDGYVDLLLVGVNAPVSVIATNNGDGTFSTSTIPNSLSNPVRLPTNTLGTVLHTDGFLDLNGDGVLDFILSDFPTDRYATYISDGSGGYIETVYNVNYTLGSPLAHYTTFAGDLDGDGDADLITQVNGQATGADVSIHIHHNDGTGVFTEDESLLASATRGTSTGARVAVGDLNNDGYVDLVNAGTHVGMNEVFLNDGDGTFTLSETLATTPGVAYVNVLQDLDNDGFIDIAFASNGNNTTEIYLNDGDGTFTFSSTEPISYAGFQLDFNQDGELDLISAPGASNPLGTELFIRFGTAPFAFDSQVLQLFDYGDEFNFINVANDFNDDGFLDLWVRESTFNNGGRGDENSVRIYLNTDNDSDGLTNDEEAVLGTSSINPDTDGDGFNDIDERDAGSDPTVTASTPEDLDGDGLTNDEEITAGTDPVDPDSDGDGFTDAEELAVDSDPNGTAFTPLDFDGDGLTNDQEAVLGTNARSSDSDSDGVLDAVDSCPLDATNSCNDPEAEIEEDDPIVEEISDESEPAQLAATGVGAQLIVAVGTALVVFIGSAWKYIPATKIVDFRYRG